MILYSFVVLLRGLYYVRIPLLFGEISIKLLKNLCRNYMIMNNIITACIYAQIVHIIYASKWNIVLKVLLSVYQNLKVLLDIGVWRASLTGHGYNIIIN